MKTATIENVLKSNLLIVELPTAETEISIGSDTNGFFHIYTEMFHGYTLLGSPDEIKEEDAAELVESQTFPKDNISYMDYKLSKGNVRLFGRTAKESLLSAIEKEIYWENSYEKYRYAKSTNPNFKIFTEAEKITFHRNRTIIFKKNN